MAKVSFCTPVSFASYEGYVSSTALAVERVDDYFCLGGRKACVMKCEDNKYFAEMRHPLDFHFKFHSRNEGFIQAIVKIVLIIVFLPLMIVLLIPHLIAYQASRVMLNVLKVVSYATGIIPLIMLILKAALRSQYNISFQKPSV